MGSTAAPAVVRRALAPNPEAPGGTKRWANFGRYEWGAGARPTAPEAGALPKPTVLFRLRLGDGPGGSGISCPGAPVSEPAWFEGRTKRAGSEIGAPRA